MTCARVFDPDNAGLEHWHAGLPPQDPRAEFSERRLQCYDLVMDSLTVFEEKCTEARTSTADNGIAALDDPETVRSHAYELAFSSDDEMFHSTLYDWLINRKLADDLLEVRKRTLIYLARGLIMKPQMRPAFLEAHLKREPVSVEKYQLLWQFYVKNGQPLRAAEVLGVLAESTQ